MADYTEAEYTLLAHQEHTHATTDTAIIGTEQAVTSQLGGTLYVYHANIEVTANATGVKYILQGRPSHGGATDTERWTDLVTFQTGTTAAVRAQIVAAGEAIGQTQLEVKADPTTAFLSGSDLYMHDAGAVAGGEWGKCDYSATGGNHYVYVVDGLTGAMVEDDEIWTQAEVFAAQVDLAGIAYVRGLVNHSAATGSDIVFEALLRVATDIE